MATTETLPIQPNLIDEVQSELKANLEDLGLMHNGKPTDEGAIVVEGQGHAPSPNTAILNTHTNSKKKNKSKKNKKTPVDPTKPTDEDIQHKQNVIEDVAQAITSGDIHLNHVPLPEENQTESEGEDEDFEEIHNGSTHKERDVPLYQPTDVESSFFEISHTNHHQSKSSETPSSVLYSLFKFSGIIKIVPLIIRCVINTLILFFITKILSFYGGIFSRLDWCQKKISNYLPLVVLGVLHFASTLILNINGRVNHFVDSKKQENEEKIQRTYELIVKYCKALSQDFHTIEDSVQDYSPTLRVRENINLMIVLSVRSFLWVTLPFFEHLKSRICCKNSKKENVNV